MPEFQPSMDYPTGLDEFTRDYLTAMEWMDVNSDHMPEMTGDETWSAELIEKAKEDCESFQETNAADLAVYREKTGNSGGVDFWLTRNGHGVGFWDRGLGAVGSRLSAAASVFNCVDVYRSDDGEICV